MINLRPWVTAKKRPTTLEPYSPRKYFWEAYIGSVIIMTLVVGTLLILAFATIPERPSIYETFVIIGVPVLVIPFWSFLAAWRMAGVLAASRSHRDHYEKKLDQELDGN